MAGSLTAAFYNTQPNAAYSQLKADLQAFKPGTQPTSYSNVPAYFAADMFIQALKKVGRNITPEAVQHALAIETWQIPGLAGPTKYPQSTVGATPACGELLQDNADGSGYTVVNPFTCFDPQFKIDPKFTG